MRCLIRLQTIERSREGGNAEGNFWRKSGMRKKGRISDTGGNISETEMTSGLVRYSIVAMGLFPETVKGAANTVIH